MKKKIFQILFIFVLSISLIYGLLFFLSKQVLVKKIDSSIQQIITKESDEKEEGTKTEISALYLYNILNLNIYEHFPELAQKYDTKLKRKKYEETDDYLILLKEIKKEKEYILNQEYNMIINQYVELSNYVIKDGGFYLRLPYANGYWTYYDAIQMNSNDPAINNINGFMINGKPHYDINSFRNNEFYYSLFIKCDEDTAFEIEENSDSIDLSLKFMINESGHKIDYNVDPNNGQTYNPQPLIMTKNALLVIRSNNTVLYQIEM